MDYFIGIDVGTQSVRAGLVNENGVMINSASKPIKTWNPLPDHYEQSSDEIWSSCCDVVKKIITDFPEVNRIKGVGFDATCSLVVLDESCKPLSISTSGNPEQNIMLWMDHRAKNQAERINKTSHDCLKFVGGIVSPEMEIPKLLWLKENLTSCWTSAGHFFDLPDFLTWRATGNFSRSLCSLVCKWLYQANSESHGWPVDFLKLINLDDLTENDFKKIGNKVQIPGEPCGNGLTFEAARELGLLPGTPVATSIIDAHAGGIGLLGCLQSQQEFDSLTSRMAVICGTSTCHMTSTRDAEFVSGIWGPYYSAMVPGMWLLEAGQSAAGVLIDHIINTHPAKEVLNHLCIKENRHIQEILNSKLEALMGNLSLAAELVSDLHVLPDFHGNRSPLADSTLKGMICGLTLSSNEEDLLRKYLATVQALSYGTRHIIDSLKKKNILIKTLLMCGGLAKNPLYVQMHADVTGLPVIIPEESESVLLGGAILAARASEKYSSVPLAMNVMCGRGTIISPNLKYKSLHDKKYQVFLELLCFQKRIQNIMK
ncbi:FGGY carbohydrate kinase domain-containing protein-like [Centruroides sculpturatus]|uniref:FGGY carbohydrate kinase domain-containing protein-like n=1 Tax=Centruroides sculpturatus TaxID=218467 RepID=UPI000C6E2722|nr:FGGY carbohydrate kinase domain-containing protein-like [Centruroides sculpturatus]